MSTSYRQLDPIERLKQQEEEQRKPKVKTKRALLYVGSPHCPDCGCKLRTRRAWSHDLEWIVTCHNLHAYKISAKNGKERIQLEKIPVSDPNHPSRRNEHAK